MYPTNTKCILGSIVLRSNFFFSRALTLLCHYPAFCLPCCAPIFFRACLLCLIIFRSHLPCCSFNFFFHAHLPCCALIFSCALTLLCLRIIFFFVHTYLALL